LSLRSARKPPRHRAGLARARGLAHIESNQRLLHAYELGSTHLRTGKKLDFTARVPADFEDALKALRPAP